MNNDRISEIIKQISFTSFGEKTVKAKSLQEAYLVIQSLVERIIEVTKNDPISIKVALLYEIGDNAISKHLLESEDEEFLRAAVLLKYLYGFGPNLLRDDSNLVKIISSMQVMQEERINFDKKNSEQIIKILSEYLNKMDSETALNQLKIDLKAFVMGLKDIHESIFADDDNNYKSKIVDSLFLSEFLTLDELNYIFSEIVLKNNLLKKYDFTKVIEERPQYLVAIKGLFRKIGSETLDIILTDVKEGSFENFDGLFRDIITLNIDDIDGLKWFFREVNKRIINNQKFYQYMQSKKYYKMFNDIDIEKVYSNNLIRFLNNNSNIDESIIETIGTYDGFLDNFDKLLDLFINSKDEIYKTKLLIPLIVALIEKQKRKYGLDFTVVFSSANLNDATLGSYNREKNKLYINPDLHNLSNNLDSALVKAVNTIFHEVRHVKQYKEVESRDDFDFDNLVMAMDYYLALSESGYYAPNYEHLSFERDARDIAYVDTMSFFSKYPDIQKLVKKHREIDYHLSNYIRKERDTGSDRYYGLVFYFMGAVISELRFAKGNPKYREYIYEKIKRYPVFFKFFDIDFENCSINTYDGDYYETLLEEFKGTEKEGIIKYSLDSLIYSINICRYLNKRASERVRIEDGYNEDIIKEIDQNVRK